MRRARTRVRTRGGAARRPRADGPGGNPPRSHRDRCRSPARPTPTSSSTRPQRRPPPWLPPRAQSGTPERTGSEQMPLPRATTHRSSSASRGARASTSPRCPATGRDGRVRKQDVLAFLRARGAGAEPPLHSESPYREEAPEAEAEVRQPAERLSRMRRSIAAHMVAVAKNGRALHLDHRGRHVADRDGPAAARAHLPAVRRPLHGGGAPGPSRAERDARGRDAHSAPRGASRHRRLARPGRPDRAGPPRRAGPLPRGPRQAHHRVGSARAGRRARRG